MRTGFAESTKQGSQGLSEMEGLNMKSAWIRARSSADTVKVGSLVLLWDS